MYMLTSGQGWHGGGGPWFGLMWLAVLVAVVGGAVFLMRRRPGARTEPGAEAVLATRYARGDIDDQEYRDRLAVLRETHR